MTDRQFVKQCIKISEEWGEIDQWTIGIRDWPDAARLCAEWLENELWERGYKTICDKQSCAVEGAGIDETIAEAHDKRAALLSAAKALIEKENQ